MKSFQSAPGTGWQLAYHGTVNRFAAFSEEQSLRVGGDANSALGVHLATSAETALHYARMAQEWHSRNGEQRTPRVLVVAYRETPAYDASHEEFFCQDLAEHPVGHPLHVTEQELADDELLDPVGRFRSWLRTQGWRTVVRDDVEGLGGHIIVLDPADTCVVFTAVGEEAIQRLVSADRLLRAEGEGDAVAALRRLEELLSSEVQVD